MVSHHLLLGERYIPGVSDVTPEDCLKQEVLHQLYVAPLSHSELLKQLKVQCMLLLNVCSFAFKTYTHTHTWTDMCTYTHARNVHTRYTLHT